GVCGVAGGVRARAGGRASRLAPLVARCSFWVPAGPWGGGPGCPRRSSTRSGSSSARLSSPCWGTCCSRSRAAGSKEGFRACSSRRGTSTRSSSSASAICSTTARRGGRATSRSSTRTQRSPTRSRKRREASVSPSSPSPPSSLPPARRWRRATPRWRHAFGLAFWSGFAAVLASAISIASRAPYRSLGWVDAIAYGIVAAVPLALTIDLLRGTLGRGAVADLVVELGDTRAPGHLRDALARALHDPTLSLAYWLPQQRRYVDVEGRSVDLPPDDVDTVTTIVEREGSPVAALVHDATLRDQPELVQAVGAAAGLALENERLQADLRARLAELRASRARMVEATDAERRRLERNLHDGTQQRLVSISIALALAEAKLASDGDGARGVLEEARAR